MLHSGETAIELTGSMRGRIRKYAREGGGIYRMNTAGASYYSFTPFKDEKGKIDFCGGWDWAHTVSTHFEYVYDMAADKFFTTEDFIKEKKK